MATKGGRDKLGLPPASIRQWSAVTSALIFIAGTLIIAISFFWEWGYWSFFGISLTKVPMSIENLTNAFLAWMPLFLKVAISLSFMALIWWLVDRKNYGKEKSMLAQFSANSKNSHEEVHAVHVAHRVFYMFSVFMAIGVPFVLSTPEIFEHFSNWTLVRFAASFLFFYAIFAFYRVSYIIWIIFYAAYAAIIFFSMAQIAAFEDSSGICASIHIKGESEIQQLQAVVLRHNHDFIYAYDPLNEKILIWARETVKHISYDAEVDAPFRSPFSGNSAQE